MFRERCVRASPGRRRGWAAKAGLAGLIVTPGYDLRYLIGSRAQTFERLTALFVPAAGQPTVIVPRLELAASRNPPALTSD